jgi:glycerophosphoryl diester phosphodiesterase
MSAASRPLVIGHRGSPGYRPEHTAASFLLAIEQGADALEPDLVLSQDGVFVVRHENEISGTTDVAQRDEFADRRTTKMVDGQRLTGWFTEDFTWAELATLRCRERIPHLRPANTAFDYQFAMLRLSDVLSLIDEAALDGELRAVLEIKHAEYFASVGFDVAALLLAELNASGWDARPEQLIIESFELGVLDELRERNVAASLVFLMESEGAPADELALDDDSATTYEFYRSDAGLASLVGRVDGVSLAKHDIFERNSAGQTTGVSDVVQRAHALGLSVFTWTLRPENHFLNTRFRSSPEPAKWGDWQGEFALALQAGVDGIFVDCVDLGVQARAAFVSSPSRTLEEI